jgi:predicted nucleotidyltransferase
VLTKNSVPAIEYHQTSCLNLGLTMYMGNARKCSDIDVALIGKNQVSRRVASQLADALENNMLPYTVDIVDFLSASPKLQQQIKRNGIALGI